MPEAKLDHPWEDVLAKANEILRTQPYVQVFQKWTCTWCNSRQTMEKPNTFYEEGSCEECKRITNIKDRGHNFLLYIKR